MTEDRTREMPAEVRTRQIRTAERQVLRVELGSETFELPFMLLGGKHVAYLDISGQVRLIEAAAELLAARLRAEGLAFDTLINPVAKSNALAHALAVRLGVGQTVVARKRPGQVSVQYRSVTTPEPQTLSLEAADVAQLRGKRVLIVDDVIGAGGTSQALMALVRKSGAEAVGRAVIAVEGGQAVPEDVRYLFTLDVAPADA